MLPQKIFDKNGVIWGVPKYVITNLKIHRFKVKKNQEDLIAIFLSMINIAEHDSTKINTFRVYNGGLGASTLEAEQFFFKNQTKWRLFLIFFVFWQGSLNPKNYEPAS